MSRDHDRMLALPGQECTAAGVFLAVMQQDEEDVMLWLIANMLGLIAREPGLINDPYAPAGVTTLPSDQMTRALLHRYAHALLNLEFDCSKAFGCRCSDIDRTLNAPPPDHEQPTMTIPVQRLTPIITNPKLGQAKPTPDERRDHR